MGKLIIFRLEDGNFDSGFPINLQIAEDDPESITHPFTIVKGKLPPLPTLSQNYQTWQHNYRNLSTEVRLGAPIIQITNISHSCQNHADNLKQQLNKWYNSQTLAKVREKLLSEVNNNEEIRLLVQTQDLTLRRLPWHIFFESFLDSHPRAEVALSPAEYATVNLNASNRNAIKILAILGNNTGIDIDTDKQIIASLSDAEPYFLINPSRQQLNDYLYEESWDILFFAGHSNSQGQFQINTTDFLTITELKNALTKAIHNGLRLAIFNSCDGLGLAQALETLQLSQIIVMREIVPDIIAQRFLREFLTAFAKGESLYLSVRQAREKLQPLEKKYPCATWLPVICQNPATQPLTWQSLHNLAINPQVKTVNYPPLTPENLEKIVLVKNIGQATLNVEYKDITKIQADVLVSSDDIYLSMGGGVSASLLKAGGKVIREEAQRRTPKQLGQVAITTAGNLSAEYLFHAIVLDYENPELTNADLIQKVTRRCLDLAEAQGVRSIAFPALVTGSTQVSPEQAALGMMMEIVKYLSGQTCLEKVTIAIYAGNYKQKYILDEKINRFYTQVSGFLDLHLSMEIRRELLQDLTKIYQTRKMQSAAAIIGIYEEQLNQIQQNFLAEILGQELDDLNAPINSHYHQSLAEVAKTVENSSIQEKQTVIELHQNFSEIGQSLWENLQLAQTETDMIKLLESVNLDIDAIAWVNDQYEMAIASLDAKLKTVKNILEEQLNELKQGQQLLHQQLKIWYLQGILAQKVIGNERKLSFTAYPKVELKVKAEELPSEYRSEKISYTANKNEIKQAHSQGIDISKWAEVDPNFKVKFGFK